VLSEQNDLLINGLDEVSNELRRLSMRIFIGSSKESVTRGSVLKVALWLEECGQQPVRWNHPGVFRPGEYIFPRLIEIAGEVDAAILLFAEDDVVWYRDDIVGQPRDNVLLEYGLFAGVLGSNRVIVAREGEARIPSDLGGLIYLALLPGQEITAQMHVLEWVKKAIQRPAAGESVHNWENATMDKLSPSLIYLLRHAEKINDYRVPRLFGEVIKASQVSTGEGFAWEKASDYACRYLLNIGLLQRQGGYGFRVAISELGKALLSSEKAKNNFKENFKKDLLAKIK
jgi:predicted nucleotide-binding protein